MIQQRAVQDQINLETWNLNNLTAANEMNDDEMWSPSLTLKLFTLPSGKFYMLHYWKCHNDVI